MSKQTFNILKSLIIVLLIAYLILQLFLNINYGYYYVSMQPDYVQRSSELASILFAKFSLVSFSVLLVLNTGLFLYGVYDNQFTIVVYLLIFTLLSFLLKLFILPQYIPTALSLSLLALDVSVALVGFVLLFYLIQTVHFLPLYRDLLFV